MDFIGERQAQDQPIQKRKEAIEMVRRRVSMNPVDTLVQGATMLLRNKVNAMITLVERGVTHIVNAVVSWLKRR